MIKLNDSGVILEDKSHTYWLGEKQLSGITGVLSRRVFPDMYKGVPKKVLNNKAKYGTGVHEDIYMYDINEEILSDEVRGWADAKSKMGFKVIDSEYIVTDYEHFASPIDKVIELDGGLYLLDIKTTASLHVEYLSYQLSIYKYLFSIVNPDVEIAGLFVAWINGERCDIIPVEEISVDVIKELLQCEIEDREFVKPNKVEIPVEYEQKALELVKNVFDIVSEIKRLETLKEEYNTKIEELFSQFNIDSLESDSFVISRTKGYIREGIDSKKLKDENPELYEKYSKLTLVKPSIKTRLKK